MWARPCSARQGGHGLQHTCSLSLQVVLHRVLSYSGVMLHLLQV